MIKNSDKSGGAPVFFLAREGHGNSTNGNVSFRVVPWIPWPSSLSSADPEKS
jgi:hypothetical protein